MNNLDVYEFTVRNEIKGDVRVTQRKYYLLPATFKLMCSFYNLITFETEKGKNCNKDYVNMLKSELKKIVGEHDKHEYFTDSSVYFKAIGLFIWSSEGWYNTKKIN